MAKPPELILHSVVELERNVRDCTAFLMERGGAASYGYPAQEMLEILTEALAYARIREGSEK
jgi:hypothetical protein